MADPNGQSASGLCVQPGHGARKARPRVHPLRRRGHLGRRRDDHLHQGHGCHLAVAEETGLPARCGYCTAHQSQADAGDGRRLPECTRASNIDTSSLVRVELLTRARIVVAVTGGCWRGVRAWCTHPEPWPGCPQRKWRAGVRGTRWRRRQCMRGRRPPGGEGSRAGHQAQRQCAPGRQGSHEARGRVGPGAAGYVRPAGLHGRQLLLRRACAASCRRRHATDPDQS